MPNTTLAQQLTPGYAQAGVFSRAVLLSEEISYFLITHSWRRLDGAGAATTAATRSAAASLAALASAPKCWTSKRLHHHQGHHGPVS
jgi:hypothetical protein